MTIHQAPSLGGGDFPCCGAGMYDIPAADGVSIIPGKVTCTPVPSKVPDLSGVPLGELGERKPMFNSSV